ncbi:hypothetical protein PAMP_013309 [Pampus punctatissimus]
MQAFSTGDAEPGEKSEAGCVGNRLFERTRRIVDIKMPVRAVTTRFMYKGLCTIPDVLTYRTPVSLPEDEVEGCSGSQVSACLCFEPLI